MDKKKIVMSKVLIIMLSLMALLNGLGLIVAGKKVNNKKWKTYGFLYIISEWILAMTGIGIAVVVILYFASIVHTIIICEEYGEILCKGETHNAIEIAKEDSIITKDFMDCEEEKLNDKKEGININNLQIDIGSACITGDTKNKLNIEIKCKNGPFEFITDGNSIVAYVVNGKCSRYEG